MDLRSGITYKEGGTLELIRERDGKHFLAIGKVESIGGIAITQKSATLPDANSDFDLEFSTGKEGEITVNLSSFVPSLYAALTGADCVDEPTGTMREIKLVTVPEDGTVTLDPAPEGDTILVMDGDNKEFTEAATTPAEAGEYSVTTGKVTFASADAGKLVYIAYDAPATDLKKVEIETQTNADVFRLIVRGKAILAENEGVTVEDQLTVDRVKVSGEVKMPDRSKEPKGWSFTLKLQSPRAGRKAVDYKYQMGA